MEKKAILLILLIVLFFVIFAGADDIHSIVQQGNLTKTHGADNTLLEENNGRSPLLNRRHQIFLLTFAEEATDQNFKSKFVCAENKGDLFILHK